MNADTDTGAFTRASGDGASGDGVPGGGVVDVAVVGAGAAGLFAAIWAGRRARELGVALRVAAFDGAAKLGAKILVAGGGRCNVTHHAVDERAYAGSSRNSVKQVLRAFTVEDTVAFFESLGVRLKREDTGKLFPTTDDAHSVLDALLAAARAAGVALRHPARVTGLRREGDHFALEGPFGTVPARCVVLATGGKSLPKTGSDGGGYALAQAMGHTNSEHVFPALVPLRLEDGCVLRGLSGLTLPAAIELRSGTGKRLERFENSTLLTHFGLSGPGVLDVSRYYTAARTGDAGARLVMHWLPGMTREAIDAALLGLGKRGVEKWLAGLLPDRLAAALCEQAGVPAGCSGADLRRETRLALLTLLTEYPLPVAGDRGWLHAEVTAGGVPLSEVNVKTMASRVCPGLFVCGELCDVDGRIGGFNFQWAWSSGYLAGRAAVEWARSARASAGDDA